MGERHRQREAVGTLPDLAWPRTYRSSWTPRCPRAGRCADLCDREDASLQFSRRAWCRVPRGRVLDLRTLSPWDQEAVYARVEKTGRVIVAYVDSLSWRLMARRSRRALPMSVLPGLMRLRHGWPALCRLCTAVGRRHAPAGRDVPHRLIGTGGVLRRLRGNRVRPRRVPTGY